MSDSSCKTGIYGRLGLGLWSCSCEAKREADVTSSEEQLFADVQCWVLQVEASFHNVDHLVTLSTVGGHTLRVEVERKADAHRWSGDFPAQRAHLSGLMPLETVCIYS